MIGYSLKIVLVEDSDSDADLLIRFLKEEKIDFSYVRVWEINGFIKALSEFAPDLIISDHTLPQFNGMEAFRIMKNENKNIPFVLVTGTVSEKLLTQYMKEGISDYILKDNLLRLPSAIENVVNKKQIEKLYNELAIASEELKSAHSSIKDSINYAKIIQEASFPDQSILKSAFPKSFILFKPKDVLSGDFYWFNKLENKFYIAVADCTGHGVPGALLSMMGNNLINEAVNIRKLSQPSEILDRLNKQVRKILKQDTTLLRDGMDIAFCSFDLENKTMSYAGANRSLFIVRERKLLEYKPDKMAIGELHGNKKYTNNNIDIQQGDKIFIFSDGFSDQFHFKTDKKMTSKRMKELLTKSTRLPSEHQEYILNTYFDEWKGNKEQVDDVLLVCIEID